ncbi:hypothetical protein [Cryobacterium zhongshanensis]|uniref:Uncharacterized protein n=1 Tax=Cryobacterium zhongshanensis TaxID=2928153 RepID=A0AA41QYV3_9MICO|nr:hypothetical protein [Cryobacterium zhongshanensis]MCI4660062.1 hypothetical protein [Cryobacterium zhongshanensis]
MIKKKIAAAGIIVLALTGIGSGAALAATPTAPTAATSATPAATETPGVESPTETPGVESATAGDGNDGGHADAEGVDVNNEGGAAEK